MMVEILQSFIFSKQLTTFDLFFFLREAILYQHFNVKQYKHLYNLKGLCTTYSFFMADIITGKPRKKHFVH